MKTVVANNDWQIDTPFLRAKSRLRRLRYAWRLRTLKSRLVSAVTAPADAQWKWRRQNPPEDVGPLL